MLRSNIHSVGNMLVVGGVDGMIRVFDMFTGMSIMHWPAHERQVTRCARHARPKELNSCCAQRALLLGRDVGAELRP